MAAAACAAGSSTPRCSRSATWAPPPPSGRRCGGSGRGPGPNLRCLTLHLRRDRRPRAKARATHLSAPCGCFRPGCRRSSPPSRAHARRAGWLRPSFQRHATGAPHTATPLPLAAGAVCRMRLRADALPAVARVARWFAALRRGGGRVPCRHGGFLRELMAHISVASYGNCYRNADEEQNVRDPRPGHSVPFSARSGPYRDRAPSGVGLRRPVFSRLPFPPGYGDEGARERIISQLDSE